MGYAEQNLFIMSRQLVGDKDPRRYEFSARLRVCDASRSGSKLGVASLTALCSVLLKKNFRSGLIIAGEIDFGGSIEPIYNQVALAEIAVEK
jgi:ATP-dependent Lon protease